MTQVWLVYAVVEEKATYTYPTEPTEPVLVCICDSESAARGYIDDLTDGADISDNDGRFLFSERIAAIDMGEAWLCAVSAYPVELNGDFDVPDKWYMVNKLASSVMMYSVLGKPQAAIS